MCELEKIGVSLFVNKERLASPKGGWTGKGQWYKNESALILIYYPAPPHEEMMINKWKTKWGDDNKQACTYFHFSFLKYEQNRMTNTKYIKANKNKSGRIGALLFWFIIPVSRRNGDKQVKDKARERAYSYFLFSEIWTKSKDKYQIFNGKQIQKWKQQMNECAHILISHFNLWTLLAVG